MLRIGLIIGSTRQNRFADVPARWLIKGAAGQHDLELETLGLRDQNLALLDEPTPPVATRGVYSNPAAEAWRLKIGTYDGFIATVAEYNHGPTAVLKNALDSACFEWRSKPIAFVGYGIVGGARAIEQLRVIVTGLGMVPIYHEVNIGREQFLSILRDGKTLDDYDSLARARGALFGELLRWSQVLKHERERTSHAAGAAQTRHSRSRRS
jgi:NAD(P)H-dependent FMN reductase